MYKIYGSNMCPDCIEAKRNFDKYNIEYQFIDITSSLKNLKEFLKLRDSSSFFLKAKDKGLIGIPVIIKEDGSLTFYYEKIVIDKGYKVLEKLSDYSDYKKEEKSDKIACSLDGKGC